MPEYDPAEHETADRKAERKEWTDTWAGYFMSWVKAHREKIRFITG